MAQDAAMLGILIQVRGEVQLNRLAESLDHLEQKTFNLAHAKQMAVMQSKIELQTLRNQNNLLYEQANLSDTRIMDIAREKNAKEDMIFQEEKRMQIAQEADRYQSWAAQNGIMLSNQEARTMAENNMAIIESEAQKQIAFRQTMFVLRTNMRALFMMQMSLNQVAQALKPLVKGNETLTKAIDTFKATMNLAIGPMLVYNSMLMIIENSHGRVALTATYMGAAFGAAFFWILAFQQKSAGIRSVMFAVAAAMTVFAIATWAVAMGLTTIQALGGNMGAIVLAAAGFTALMGIVGYISAPKAQTLTGHRKRVRKGGMAELDDDEVVQRVSKDGTRGGGGDTHIYLPDSYNGSMSDAKITVNGVRRMLNSGYGTVKYQKKVVTG